MPAVANTPPVALPGPDVNGRPRQAIPFRRATIERSNQLPAESLTLTTSQQTIERVIEGTGYLHSIRLQVIATVTGQSNTVALQEDGPYSALASVILRDVNGEIVNCPSGWYLWLANLINRNYANRFLDQSSESSSTVGTPATGGSFTFFVDVPVATNRRDLLGLLGNQDRAQKYTLRTDLAGSGSIYSTLPSTSVAVAINKQYESYSVPMPVGPNGVQQQIVPDSYGTIHFTTVTTSDAVPLGGSTVNHYLRRIGNTVRYIALIFRSNSSRATADSAANRPTLINFKVGDDTLFVESYALRRTKMYERFGFDLPAGVLVYDTMHDFDNTAGFELGNDYYHTQALVNAQFQITYPSGFGSTANSLNILTDDLVFAQPS